MTSINGTAVGYIQPTDPAKQVEQIFLGVLADQVNHVVANAFDMRRNIDLPLDKLRLLLRSGSL